MECFLDCGVYNIIKLSILNRVRKYKKSHSLTEMLRYDGKTVDPEILLAQHTDIISTRQFAIEQPPKKD